MAAARPIPQQMQRDFYRVAWQIAETGSYTDDRDEIRTPPERLRVRHALGILWLTACAFRWCEFAALQVSDVHAGASSVYCRRCKGSQSRDIRVPPHLIELTERWRRREGQRDNEILLPSSTGAVQSWSPFKQGACGMMMKIFPLKISSHSFRHTAARMLYTPCQDIQKVQALLGHRHAMTTEIYVRDQENLMVSVPMHEKQDPPPSPSRPRLFDPLRDERAAS